MHAIFASTGTNPVGLLYTHSLGWQHLQRHGCEEGDLVPARNVPSAIGRERHLITHHKVAEPRRQLALPCRRGRCIRLATFVLRPKPTIDYVVGQQLWALQERQFISKLGK